MRMKNRPDPNYLRSILSYDENTGLFTWLESRGTVSAGYTAGAESISRGKIYIYIKIDKRLYKAHHLAWLFYYGSWPTKDVDHRDGDSTNNKICNLRECTMAQNKANSKKYKNNTSGFKGVSKHPRGYVAYISKDHKRTHLGLFPSAEEAAAAYRRAAQESFGEFARPE